MKSFPESMNEFKIQLNKGAIIIAYQGLMNYIRDLRSHLSGEFPDYSTPGNIYYGYMDMTYFAVIPDSFANRGLKIAIVFLYDEFRFEIWLSARNKDIQDKFRKKFIEQYWSDYPITPPGKGIDSILDSVLVEDPDFSDLDSLTDKIKSKTQQFIKVVEVFLLNN